MRFLKASHFALLEVLLLSCGFSLNAAVEVTVDAGTTVGEIKPVNAVGQPPMAGQLGRWGMMKYLKDAGIPYARLHDVGGWLGGGLYVDIPNIFPDFDADETKIENYRFAYTDSLLKALVNNGVEPFFRLGVTIENFVERGYPRVNTMPPKDYAKWARICEHVIRHYTEGWGGGFKYRMEYWEIWNEPDNNPDEKINPLWGAGFDEYMKMYGIVAPYLKEKFPHLKIGGYGSCGFYAGVGAKQVKAANSSPRLEHFVDCAHRFLKTAREKNWPLDFFSFHSYSPVKEALRQVDYADGLLNGYGFTSDKTERIFNEWLPGPSQKKLGTAQQAAEIAAEIVGLQNGPCSMACVYDARCGIGAYSPLFNPMTLKPHKAYYVFVAFNELRKLGNAVECRSSDKDVYAAAAANGGKVAVMIVNLSGRAQALRINGISGNGVCRITDDRRTYGETALPEILPVNAVVVYSAGVRAANSER